MNSPEIAEHCKWVIADLLARIDPNRPITDAGTLATYMQNRIHRALRSGAHPVKLVIVKKIKVSVMGPSETGKYRIRVTGIPGWKGQDMTLRLRFTMKTRPDGRLVSPRAS